MEELIKYKGIVLYNPQDSYKIISVTTFPERQEVHQVKFKLIQKYVSEFLKGWGEEDIEAYADMLDQTFEDTEYLLIDPRVAQVLQTTGHLKAKSIWDLRIIILSMLSAFEVDEEFSCSLEEIESFRGSYITPQVLAAEAFGKEIHREEEKEGLFTNFINEVKQYKEGI